MTPQRRLGIAVGASTVVGACLAGWLYRTGTASIDMREEQMRIGGAQVNEARAIVREMEAELERAKAVQAGRLAERERFEGAKAQLKAKRPKTETEMVAMLGEPSNTMEFTGGGDRFLYWYFETKEIGRDAIWVNVDKQGRLSLLQY
jgi:hypothetical protein